jgi:predicted phosphoribosyltransferase
MLIQQRAYTSSNDEASFECDDRYEDRADAGRQLAVLLYRYRGRQAVVLALPPGGVAVAGEVARGLRLPLDMLGAREFAVQPYPALGAGAISEGGGLCFNAAVLRAPGVTPGALWREARRTRRELLSLVRAYRHGRALPSLGRRTIILVDDGLSDGLAQLAALSALRRLHPRRCIVATPYCDPQTMELVAPRADLLVALTCDAPEPRQESFHWSRSLSDDDAAILLERYQMHMAPLS